MALPFIAYGLWAAAGAFLSTIIVPLIWRAVAAIGLGFVTYTGIDLMLDELKIMVQGQFAGLPSLALQAIGMIKLDVGFTIILSSLLIRAVMGTASQAASAGMRKPTWNPPGPGPGSFPA